MRQSFDNFVNQETQQRPQRSAIVCFVIRKTLNQRSLWFRAPTQSLGDCIAWYGGADDFDVQLQLLPPNAGSPEVLVGMLDEDRRDNTNVRLANDHQPSYRGCPSLRGCASRRRIVHRNAANQLRS